MRFSLQFHQHQNPSWSEHYIRYDLLKHLLKQAQSKAHAREEDVDLHELDNVVQEDLERARAFYEKLLKIAATRIATYNHDLVSPRSASSRCGGTREAYLLQMEDEVWLSDIGEHLRDIREYTRSNNEALQRIADKLMLAGVHLPRALSSGLQEPLDAARCTLAEFNKIVCNNFDPTDLVDASINAYIQEEHPEDQHEVADGDGSNLRQLGLAAAKEKAIGIQEVLQHGDMTHQLDHESLARLIQVLLRPNTIDTSILQATVRDKNLQFAERALRALGKCRSTAIEDQVMSAVDALVVECTRSADVAGLQLIVKYFDSLNAVDRSGRTALYLAALQGSVAVVRCLLNTSSDDRPLALDKPDGIHGRTPLMACCIRGHAEIAEMLLRAGADPKVQDRLGWTAREHAAYRGRLFLAASLPNISNTSPVMGPVRRTSSGPSHKLRSVADQGKSVLLVTPGPADTRSSAKCLDLVSPDLASQTLSIEFLPLNVDYDPATLQLPLLEDRINDPWIVEYVEDVRLQFKLYGLSTATSTSVLLGSGVALLSQPQTESPDERQPLRRDITFPIQGVKSMTAIATMTINVLNVKPYRSACRTVRPRSDHGFWKYPQRRTTVIGHRGSGANTTAHTNIQLGENTLNSFEAATTLGATGIEFDVQLTKDLVPVIYHNFLVMETGGEMTVWNLSQTQFTHISEAQGSKGSVSSMAEARYHQRNGQLPIKPRSRSADMYEDDRVSDLVSRMMHTTEAKSKGIKGNIRGHVVQDVFPKFKDLLTKLPEDVAFDVEMKYPMLWESQDQGWDPIVIEPNVFVDTVLDLVYKHCGNRKITFSSFSPEICILLAAKQQEFPILFLNKAGAVPTGDVRASSTQQAVHFARRWDLNGVVLLSDPLVVCPRLIQHVKSKGLICASYGDLNDDPVNAKAQAGAGLDAIIVNKVKLISQTLGSGRQQ